MKKNILGKNAFLQLFAGVIVAVFGVVSAYIIIGLYSAILVSTGYYIIENNNKPDTKLLDELQGAQYAGLFIAFLGLLPWIQYFFMSFMVEGGSYAFNEIMNG